MRETQTVVRVDDLELRATVTVLADRSPVGGDDAEVPVEPSVDIVEDVRRGPPAETRLDILDGVGHTLTVDDADDIDALDPRYGRMLGGWLRTRLVPEVSR